MTILAYLQKLFSDDPELANIDISEGSNYYDLVYKTLNTVLGQSAAASIIEAADRYNLNRDIELSYDELANIASQYGIPASYSNYSSGDVTVIFNSPVDVTLPAGTIFQSNTNIFYTRNEEVILSRYLESNTKTPDGKYQSQPISVYSNSGNTVVANELGLASLPVEEIARVEHAAINTGTTGGTTTELASMIRAFMRGISNGAEESVSALIKMLYPSVTAVEIVKPGDENMTRDKMINTYIYGEPAVNEQSFKNKVYGNVRTNKNVAYRGTSATADPPNIDALYGKTELSQYQYIMLGDSDLAPLAISTDNTFIDTFSTTNNIGARTYLDCGVTEGEDYFYAHGTEWLEPGSSVNMEGDDGEGDLRKIQVIIRQVIARAYDLVSIDQDGLGPTQYRVTMDSLASEIMGKLKEGQTIGLKWVRITEEDFDLDVTIDEVEEGGETFLFTSEDAVPTGECDETYPGKATWTEYQIVGLFSLTLVEVIASVPDDISSQIGGGWFISEHGYPVGFKVANNSVYTQAGRVVLGGSTGSIQDPLKDIILNGGVGRFVGAVLRSMSVRRPRWEQITQPIPIVNTDQIMDR